MIDPRLVRLTPRQRDVLELLARGLTNAEVGGVLEISPTTVRTHVTAILATLELTNRTEAALLYAAAADSEERIQPVLDRPALCVLPFETPQGQASDTVSSTLAFGLTEDLTVLFSSWCWFPVVRIRARAAMTPDVRFLVTGGVRREDDHVLVSAHVEMTVSGQCLWSKRFVLERVGIYAERDRVAEQVVASAYPGLMAAATTMASQRLDAPDITAWELSTVALERVSRRSRADNELAHTLLAQATSLDPTHMPAHFATGLALYSDFINQWQPPQRAIEALSEAARRCQELVPSAAEGFYLSARHSMARGAWEQTISALRRAVSLNPSYAPAHALLGQTLLLTGAHEQGSRSMARAERLDPGAYVAGLAVARFCLEDHQGALSAADAVLAERPGYIFAHALAIASASSLGARDDARRRYTRLLVLHPHFSGDHYASCFGGMRTVALERLARGLREASM